ncbi:hypothetical protein P873_09845 [Arenimonas composti TR7-09 = DSM 18010]|uniref:Thioredoxin n=1 Tax=Arenimonas composti TR7-09 = DSM 18010 TaxID=1121013 RepID=A0A091BZ63_9GAMM|nr:hypothetical protein P873_09845 [Arenimonas composti TR7-09 = DSM 18010]
MFDAGLARFEQDVLLKSKEVPVLVDFWATWCGPCQTLGPILEKLAGEYGGAFLVAKVDVDQERELGGYFQIRSVPTMVLFKDGQMADHIPGALSEGQMRQFLAHHGIEPKPAEQAPPVDVEAAPVDPHAEVVRLRHELQDKPDDDGLKLDLALALLKTGGDAEARRLLDALPANLAQDDRALRAHARLEFMAILRDAPPAETLEAALATDPGDLRARHLLAVRRILEGQAAAGLEHLLEMLRRDRGYADGLPRKALVEAFRIVEDEDLVGTYRRKMASLLF